MSREFLSLAAASAQWRPAKRLAGEPGVHAQLLANTGAELNAFHAWAEDSYERPHQRSADLLDLSTIDTPRIDWKRRS